MEIFFTILFLGYFFYNGTSIAVYERGNNPTILGELVRFLFGVFIDGIDNIKIARKQ